MFRVLGIFFIALSGICAEIDFDQSKVSWKASKITGSSHTGTFKIQANMMKLDKSNKLTKVYFTIKMDSLEVTDLTGKSKSSLEAHLMSEDFLNVSKNPVAIFDAKKITDKTLEGELKLNGVTKTISFPFKRNGKVFSASVDLDRTDFGIKYGSGKFFKGLGDKVINDIVKLDVLVTLK